MTGNVNSSNFNPITNNSNSLNTLKMSVSNTKYVNSVMTFTDSNNDGKLGVGDTVVFTNKDGKPETTTIKQMQQMESNGNKMTFGNNQVYFTTQENVDNAGKILSYRENNMNADGKTFSDNSYEGVSKRLNSEEFLMGTKKYQAVTQQATQSPDKDLTKEVKVASDRGDSITGKTLSVKGITDLWLKPLADKLQQTFTQSDLSKHYWDGMEK